MKLPNKGTKHYNEIVKLGCGGHYDQWNGDYECEHGYGWDCEYCPVMEQRYKNWGDAELDEEKVAYLVIEWNFDSMEILGLYDDEQKAIDACMSPNIGYAPLKINQPVPRDGTWTGFTYPL